MQPDQIATDPSASATAPESIPTAPRAAPEIADELLDSDAVKVVRRLRQRGHIAYLVGGCVRDLLLGQRPKDFDVATSAHPHQVKETFRNCRLIGRRFRLAHVYFRGGKVIEVSTFRSNPLEGATEAAALPQDLLIRHDNVFGTEQEDARRRDFSINGLFYDIDNGKVVDHVGGKDDLGARRVRTIGNPDVRMREDPVRILRAIRFAAKCNLAIEAETLSAMKAHAQEIPRCAPPRVLEELLKLVRSGSSRRCLELLSETGVLKILLPPLAAHLTAAGDAESQKLLRALEALDKHVQQDEVPSDAVLLATLLWPLPRAGAPQGPIPKPPPPSADGAKDAAAPAPDAAADAPQAEGAPAAAAADDEIDPDLLALDRALSDEDDDEDDDSEAAGDSADGDDDEDDSEDSESGASESSAGSSAQGSAPASAEPAPATVTAAPAESGLRKVEDDERLTAQGIPTFSMGGNSQPWSLPANVVPAEVVLTEMVRTARLPRRVAERCRLILSVQSLLAGDKKRRGKFSPVLFSRQSIFPEALAVFELTVAGTGVGADQLAKWQQIHVENWQPTSETVPSMREGGERPKRRRRGGRRRRRN
ncbi:MAG: polynucleotide adenylyltransferase PcnB [Deltaproteobacteria bacterium]|nr:polynucleotide adenylyltransferase PcnB [Deltaproteobacteria bacterium]